MGTVVRIRNPWPPHEERTTILVSDLRYGFARCRPSQARFRVSRSAPNAPEHLALGAFITIERDDGFLTWGGYVTNRRLPLGDPMASYVAEDHAGAVFPYGRTAKDWQPVTASAGELIRRVLTDADARGHPPMGVTVSGEGGPIVTYEPRAETIADFLRSMCEVTGWEWELRYDFTGSEPLPTLKWSSQIGVDRRTAITFWEGRHFTEVELTQDVEGFITEGLAVGGGGDFRDRPAISANPDGRNYRKIDGAAVTEPRRPRFSPALMGSRVLIDQQVTNKQALEAAARRMHDAPEFVAETIELKLAETEIDMSTLGLGDIYRIRFADLALGLGVERDIRVEGLELDDSGNVGVVARVMREREPERWED